MDPNRQQASHRVRRVVLPSGKTIEVVHFGHDPVAPEEGELHRCRRCSSELVYPTRWSEAAEGSWQVTLRCPECEAVREDTFSQGAVDAFDEALENGTNAVVADLRRLTQANMTAEGERFFAALAADAILPEDF
jgi:hypothetical protein